MINSGPEQKLAAADVPQQLLICLSGCSHYQHVLAFGRQLSWLFLSPGFLTKQSGLVGLQILSTCPALIRLTTVCMSFLEVRFRRGQFCHCASLCFTLSSCKKKVFQTLPGRYFWTGSCTVPQRD